MLLVNSTSERPFRILLISGSGRRQYTCPGVDSKSRILMFRMADRRPHDREIDMEDSADVFSRFHHSNVRLPIAVERRLNRVLVTPRMHGIHHSTVRAETDANWSSG